MLEVDQDICVVMDRMGRREIDGGLLFTKGCNARIGVVEMSRSSALGFAADY